MSESSAMAAIAAFMLGAVLCLILVAAFRLLIKGYQFKREKARLAKERRKAAAKLSDERNRAARISIEWFNADVEDWIKHGSIGLAPVYEDYKDGIR